MKLPCMFIIVYPYFTRINSPFILFFLLHRKISVAQGWASVEQRGSNPEAPEAARAQWSAGHHRGLGHRGRSMSGQAMLQWRWGFESPP